MQKTVPTNARALPVRVFNVAQPSVVDGRVKEQTATENDKTIGRPIS